MHKAKIKGVLPPEQIFGFCKTFEKITKQFGFHLTLKTADLQDIIYTTLGDDINVNFDKLYLCVPILFPDAQTLIMFNDSIKNCFTLSFDSWSTHRKPVDTQLEYQVDIGGAQIISSPKHLTVAHQTASRMRVSNKALNVAVFDNVNVRKYHVDIDGVRYPRGGVSIDYASNVYVDQYRDLNLFYKEDVDEEILNPFINYTDMKTKYPIPVIDLSFRVDHIIPKKNQLLEEYRGATNIVRLFMVFLRHREIKRITDGKKITEINFI